jgi:folate-binding protein YgfZ
MPRSPLFGKLESLGPQMTAYHGWEIAASFSSAEQEYWTLKRSAGLLDLSHRGRLVLRGSDAPRFLHGMVTNDVQGLKPGQGNYAFLLNVQGHILADLRILRLDAQSFLLDCEPQSQAVVTQALEHHIIMDVVELEDQRDRLACLAIEGPGSREILRRVLGNSMGVELATMRLFDHLYLETIAARIVRAALSGEEGWWIFAAPDRAGELLDAILAVRADDGSAAGPVGFEALETCRIERGIPRYGIDITEKNLPQETGQMHAISFNKGCYIGQEVVERIRSRGHVNRKLVRLVMEGRQEIVPETAVFFDGGAIGATGSSAYSFGLQRTIAFGYLRREFAVDGRKVMVENVPAEVSELPASGI